MVTGPSLKAAPAAVTDRKGDGDGGLTCRLLSGRQRQRQGKLGRGGSVCLKERAWEASRLPLDSVGRQAVQAGGIVLAVTWL